MCKIEVAYRDCGMHMTAYIDRCEPSRSAGRLCKSAWKNTLYSPHLNDERPCTGCIWQQREVLPDDPVLILEPEVDIQTIGPLEDIPDWRRIRRHICEGDARRAREASNRGARNRQSSFIKVGGNTADTEGEEVSRPESDKVQDGQQPHATRYEQQRQDGEYDSATETAEYNIDESRYADEPAPLPKRKHGQGSLYCEDEDNRSNRPRYILDPPLRMNIHHGPRIGSYRVPEPDHTVREPNPTNTYHYYHSSG